MTLICMSEWQKMLMTVRHGRIKCFNLREGSADCWSREMEVVVLELMVDPIYQIFINDVTTISLDSLADPQINWIEISINSMSMTQRRSFNWIDHN